MLKQSSSHDPREFYIAMEYTRRFFSQFEGVEFNEGLPSLDEFKGEKHSLVIIDDLMHETNDVVTKLFTRVSHHTNTSVIYITQNIFHPSKENRTITLKRSIWSCSKTFETSPKFLI